MTRREAEIVMEYCVDIPRKLRIIRYHKAELNDEISSLRGMNLDGMPRGGQPGDSTAAMASRMEELGISEELRRIEREEAALRADESKIREKLSGIHSVHSEILMKRYVCGFTWERVKQTLKSAKYSIPSLKRKRNEALVMLGEKLGKDPEGEGILNRAYNAREGKKRMLTGDGSSEIKL